MKQQQEEMERKIQILTDSLAKAEIRRLREKLDCWHSDARTFRKSSLFKGNGLLLLEPIEQSFDRKDICFLYNSLTSELTAKVLNPNLMTEYLCTASTPAKTYPITYGDLDGLCLQLPPGIFPYRRVLSMHAKFAYSRALKQGWITKTETLDSYFNISDAGLMEPKGLGELTWQEVHSAIHHVSDQSEIIDVAGDEEGKNQEKTKKKQRKKKKSKK